MNIREQAVADHASILGDQEHGLGWATDVTDPQGNRARVIGHINDVWESVDPETGVLVRNQAVSVVLPLSGLKAAGLGVPTGVSRGAPWLVEFVVANTLYAYAVSEAREDRTLRSVTCRLQEYEG